MKKQEMIKVILKEQGKLWNDLQKCIDTLGMTDPITDSAAARWATIKRLVKKLGL